MKLHVLIPALLLTLVLNGFSQTTPIKLFDGRSFAGWEGDTVITWRIAGNAITGGSLEHTVPHNQFLCTTGIYEDFDLRLEFKLTGTGFVNAGVQFHSQRLTDPPYEMTGYQADLGNGYWASLYDESRRNITIVRPDSTLIIRILKPGQWNNYRIQSIGRRIRIWLNGAQTADYTEPDEKIVHSGFIALQVHGGGKTEASYRNIVLTPLK